VEQRKTTMLARVLAVSVLLACSTLYAQQQLSQRDYDFHFIVTKNAERMGMPLNTTPDGLVSYAKSLCADIPQQGVKAIIQKNRQNAMTHQGDKAKAQQVADMVFRNSVSTYCEQYTQQAFNVLNAPTSGQQETSLEPKSESSLYTRFLGLASASGIDVRPHPSYTEAYVKERAQLFCGLMNDREMVKLTSASSFPPTRWTESPKERPRLETAILVTGTETYCPQHNGLVEQWRRTNER
jgi:hypothetical protein